MSPFAATIEACPSDHEVLALIRGELRAERLARVLGHTERCSSCSVLVAQAGCVLAEPVVPPSAHPIARVGDVFGPGQLVASRYLIERQVGRGGMGEVYAALDQELNERVALKTISPAFACEPAIVERFKLELRLARRIAHFSVCRVFEFGRHELEDGSSQCFFTLQFIEGMTLRRRLLTGPPLELLEVVTLLRTLALGLQPIHEQSVVHRDIKPENVMLAAGGAPATAIWVDFGLARSDLRETVSGGQLTGTPDYLAPELLAGCVATRASDLYAFGVVMYEALTGALPFARSASFPAASRPRAVDALAPSASRSDVPADLDALVLECLAALPEQRPPSAQRVAERLLVVADTLRGGSTPVGLRARGGLARRALRRARLPLSLAIAIAAGASLALYRAEAMKEAAASKPATAFVDPAPKLSPAPPLPASSASSAAAARPTAAERAALRSAIALTASSRSLPPAAPDPSPITDFGGRR